MPKVLCPSTSPTLLVLLGTPGNHEAWDQFVTIYDPLIGECCSKAGLQAADADDVRANVLRSLSVALREFQYDPARRFRGYLRTVVVNAIRRLARERRRHPDQQAKGDEGDRLRLEQHPEPESFLGLAESIELDFHERMKIAERVVEFVRQRVEPDTWNAFWMTVIDERPAPEVASILGKGISAVYQARYRVIKLLEEEGERLMNQTPRQR